MKTTKNKPIVTLAYCLRDCVKQFKASITTVSNTCDDKRLIEINVKIDADEDASPYRLILKNSGIPHNVIVSERGAGYADMHLFFLELFKASSGDMFWLCSDDMYIQTTGWVNRLKEAHDIYQDKIVVCAVTQVRKAKASRLGNKCPILSRELIECNEYISPTMGVDRYVGTIASMIGRFIHIKDQNVYLNSSPKNKRINNLSSKTWAVDVRGHVNKIMTNMDSETSFILPKDMKKTGTL